MNLKQYLGLVATLNFATFPCIQANKTEQPKENKKKNVLMLVVDDWGAMDMSCAGSKFYETPNVDKLANNSIVFNQAYVSYPRSVPSRYSLFTGMHCARPQSVDKNELDERFIDEKSYCIAEPFQKEGYDTFFIGKWHLATKTCMPENKGFNTNIGGGHSGAPASYFPPYNKQRANNHEAARDIRNMDDTLPNEYLTDYMARKMVNYLESEHTKPFFGVCCFYAVHTPLEAKADKIEKYEQKRKRLDLTNDSFIKEEAGERKAQQNNPVYAAMIESVDDAIGDIITALKENNLYDNTIIVLISDHGGLSNRGNKRELATTNHPLKAGKGHLYEGGIKVPLIIHLPNQAKKIESDAIVTSYDLFPTLTEFCNIPIKPKVKLDGVSLISLFKNGIDKKFNNRKIYWHKASERPVPTGDYLSTAIRSGDYKLIDFYTQNRIELYNIKKDPGETRNLAKENPDLVASLLSDINAWRNSINVNMPKQKIE